MTELKTDASKELVGYQYNFVCDIGNNRQISMTGTFPKGADLTSMNTEMDKLRAMFDRQQAKSAVLAVEHELSQLVLRHNNAIDDLVRIDGKHDAKGGPSTQDKNQREIAVTTISNMQKDLEYKQGVLEKLKEEAK
jgi:hypothetical protein